MMDHVDIEGLFKYVSFKGAMWKAGITVMDEFDFDLSMPWFAPAGLKRMRPIE